MGLYNFYYSSNEVNYVNSQCNKLSAKFHITILSSLYLLQSVDHPDFFFLIWIYFVRLLIRTNK